MQKQGQHSKSNYKFKVNKKKKTLEKVVKYVQS